MVSLLSKLGGTTKSAPIEPREIFMALPQKDKGYEYPRDVQSEVWKKFNNIFWISRSIWIWLSR